MMIGYAIALGCAAFAVLLLLCRVIANRLERARLPGPRAGSNWEPGTFPVLPRSEDEIELCERIERERRA